MIDPIKYTNCTIPVSLRSRTLHVDRLRRYNLYDKMASLTALFMLIDLRIVHAATSRPHILLVLFDDFGW